MPRLQNIELGERSMDGNIHQQDGEISMTSAPKPLDV